MLLRKVLAQALQPVVQQHSLHAGDVAMHQHQHDGARGSITVAGQAVGGVSVAAGTAVLATAFSAGWVLSVAGQAIAYIPNQIGKALLYYERLTR